MATGAGKTYMAVTESYRLLKYGGFQRILFLVDRNNLGDQAKGEFDNYATPDDGRRFTELYNADKLTGAGVVASSHVVISTIQRVYAALRGQQVADTDDPGHKRTRRQRMQLLDEDLTYDASQLDRAVTAQGQIRLVLETFRDRLYDEIFPGRSTVPKTLIFCKDDQHAEEVVTLVREVFGRGNDFAAKITYTARDPKSLLQTFRNSPALRIVVSVDMIATGTDVKPLECLLFLRDVRSASYFEQMKGRGVRTIGDADFQAVTPDAETKTRFVLVDAVGVTEHDYVDAAPLNRDRSVSLRKLLDRAAALTLTEDETATLASRLAKLELELSAAERAELDGVAGEPVQDVVRRLVAAVDPDEQAAALAAAPGEDSAAVRERLRGDAVRPIAANPELRNRILELRRSHDQVIDDVSADTLLDARGVVDVGRARSVVESWLEYLVENRDEITALQLLYERPQPGRVTFAELRELADRIRRPPHQWTPDVIWNAYATLDTEHVRHCDRHTVVDLVSLVRFALGADAELVPYADKVRERYASWLTQQEQAGVQFSDRQRWWLDRIAEVVATSAGVSPDDLEGAPFAERGGVDGALRDLGTEAERYLTELNEELTAAAGLCRALLAAAFSGRLTGRSPSSDAVPELADA